MLDAYATTFIAAALAATLSAGTIAIPAVANQNAALLGIVSGSRDAVNLSVSPSSAAGRRR
jgi:hypothetical protein